MHASHAVFAIAILLALKLSVSEARSSSFAQDESQAFDFFEQKIRPMLIERCQKCHGETKQWGGLRLDSAVSLRLGGENGAVVNPNKPDESEILRRVISSDDSQRMPPSADGAKLSEVEIEYIRQWIETGAAWPNTLSPETSAMANLEKTRREHWAFQPMVLPQVPEPAEQALSGHGSNGVLGSSLTPVDAFVLAKLKANGLSFSSPADRRTMIRRATYDLTGLPPTPEEVSTFVADESSDAYERLVDKLLASTRYGEHWGRHWLDIARYADTKGYVYAREERFFVHASHYRDWVVRAFNEDMPYDTFLMNQLAADCLEPQQPEAMAAMGFLTLGRRFLGVTPDIIDDRIDVVSRGLMGLTVGCARCHDHKYDPIPTADYYSLYGVFQNSIERDIPLVKPAHKGSGAESDFIVGLRERQKKYDDYFKEQCLESEKRFRNRIGDYLFAQRELDKYPELTFNQISTKEDLLPGLVHRWQTYLEYAEQTREPIFVVWIALAQLSDEEFASKSPEICFALQQNPSAIHPLVAAEFVHAPTSAREVADRYAKLFATIEQKWNDIFEASHGDGLPAPTCLPTADEESLRVFLFGPSSPCSIPKESMANTEWLWDNGAVVELWKKQGDVERWLLQDPSVEPHFVTLVDQEPVFEPRIFRRGNPANKGDVVPRQFLSVIAGGDRKPFQHGSGRLEMAKSIVAPSNPLTARVWVNRVWQNHFGQGLVTSPSDFGLRAQPPSHPALLDWLALKFIENNWSTRWLHRTMMLSDAYRQSCSGPADSSTLALASQHDPGNRMLWRMNPRRLAFEEMRDAMIAASEEFDLTVGGKAVDMLSALPSGGFRRAIYGQVDRQFLPTVFNVFDFANPDLHTPERNETTVPQQALFKLNHPFVAGRARALAARANRQEYDSTSDRIRLLFQWTYQREPTPTEMETTTAFLTVSESAEAEELKQTQLAWSYGYGAIDEAASRTVSFEKLPTANALLWQGGTKLPDAKLGWVHIGAKTIHAGNDKTHSAIRRWTAPRDGIVSVNSNALHAHPQGDGARGILISSRHGILKKAVVFNSQIRFDVESIAVQTGDTIDFVVELHETLSYEDLTWAPTIRMNPNTGATQPTGWDAERDFRTSDSVVLSPWEQLAQVLLISNECLFLD